MTARLVTIGDSLTQGFQHGAIRRTDWSYPAMVARALGDAPLRAPDFSGSGHGGPLLDLELLFEKLSVAAGRKLDVWDIPAALVVTQRLMSHIEDYWERQEGTQPSNTGPMHHNLGVWGYEVLDAITLTDRKCALHTPEPHDNLIKQIPEDAMYRTARRVTNPAQRAELTELTTVGVAKRLAQQEGIENLIVGLGANNVLGTCATLRIRPSQAQDLERLAHERHCNLWLPEHFAEAYTSLAEQVAKLGAKRVFLMTVPHVTIAPLTRGVSPHAKALGLPEREGNYYEYYTRFWVWDNQFNPDRNAYLTRDEARRIDRTIDDYNTCIRSAARQHGFELIDICALLDQLAFRRSDGAPPYRLPQGLVGALEEHPATRFRVRPDGEVLYDSRFIRIPAKPPADDAPSETWRKQYCGGIFGLDGAHPTTSAYGILAHEVLRAMQAAGVAGADPMRLDWHGIVANDTLLTRTPKLLTSLESTLNMLFAKLPLDALIDKMSGYGAEPA